ncbi:Ig-like domain-containing protein [Deinococcus petrolearius]|uniref:Ig-like domain-containing protein n=1 Tax=Deinococcus petrolearius TaxID=1751295 RepID=A0ABW1DF95_9DEIO
MKTLILPALSLSLLLAACDGGSTPTGDATAPTVGLSAAQSGTTVTLSAAASDNMGVSRVEFYRAGTLIATDTSAPYSASLTVGSADNGAVSFSVRAYDAAGNSASDTRTLNVFVGPSTGTTLYQGVWVWALSDAGGQAVARSGLVVFDEETTGTYGKLALGGYGDAGDPQNPVDGVTSTGGAVLGPVTAQGQLQLRFLRTDTSGSLDVLADDDDNQFEQFEDGSPVFYDDDAEVRDSSGNTVRYSEFVMIQATAEVPAAGISATALRLGAVAPATFKSLGGAALAKRTVAAPAAARQTALPASLRQVVERR